jgi:nucleotide-binding universal stress UspA family protein
MFQRLLIATDMVDGLQRLAACPQHLATAGVKSVTFIHTVPLVEEGGLPREDQSKLQQRLTQLQQLQSTSQSEAELPEVKLEVLSGKSIPTITQYAQQHHPDLLVLGTAVRNLLGEKLFGSNTLGILQQVQTPLLILRPPFLQTLLADELAIRCQQLWHHLLIPVNGSKSATAMVQQLQHQLQACHPPASSPKQLTFCWVIDTVGETEAGVKQRTQAAQAELEALVAPFRTQGIQVSQQLRYGNPVVEVTAAARELAVSAILISSGNVGRFWELSIPSFAGELLRRSWHPVLFLPRSKG